MTWLTRRYYPFNYWPKDFPYWIVAPISDSISLESQVDIVSIRTLTTSQTITTNASFVVSTNASTNLFAESTLETQVDIAGLAISIQYGNITLSEELALISDTQLIFYVSVLLENTLRNIFSPRQTGYSNLDLALNINFTRYATKPDTIQIETELEILVTGNTIAIGTLSLPTTLTATNIASIIAQRLLDILLHDASVFSTKLTDQLLNFLATSDRQINQTSQSDQEAIATSLVDIAINEINVQDRSRT